MNTTNEFVNEFEALCQEMVLKMKPKNSDYARGSDPFKNLRRHGTHGIVVRMDDKICRLDSLTALTSDGIPQVKDESIEDTAMDLATYSLLLIMLNRQLKREGLPLLKMLPDIEQIREALAHARIEPGQFTEEGQ